jgi:CHAD domain-containing protein
MAYWLKRSEPVGEGIRRIAGEQFERAAGELAASHRSEVIHSARKRLKMLRALLRLVRPATGRGAFDRNNIELRDIGRMLSELRDAEVLVEVLSQFRPHGTGGAEFRQVLAQARRHRQTVRRQFKDVQTAGQARRQIIAAHERLDDWATSAIDRDAVLDGIRGSYKRFVRSGTIAVRSRADDRWHEWRKRTKDFWYHQRLLAPVWPAVFTAAVAQAKALSDDLGDDHDLAVLTMRLHQFALEVHAPAEFRRLRRLIAQRRDGLKARARENGRGWFTGKPRGFSMRVAACWAVWCD